MSESAFVIVRYFAHDQICNLNRVCDYEVIFFQTKPNN